jgi:hypothetical protein
MHHSFWTTSRKIASSDGERKKQDENGSDEEFEEAGEMIFALTD